MTDRGATKKFTVLFLFFFLLGSNFAYAELPSDGTQLFYSDDPDRLESESIAIDFIDQSLLDKIDSPEEFAKGNDVYYYSTRPSLKVPPSNITLQEHRQEQLHNVSRTTNTSKWPSTAPERKDGEYVKDAYIAFLGIEGGAQYRVSQHPLNSTYLVDRNGTVLNMLDYRTEIPTGDCTEDVNHEHINGSLKITNGTRTCISYSLENTTERRTLSIGSEEWSETGDDRRIEYTDAKATGNTSLILEATINVRIAKQTTEYTLVRDEGWVKVDNTTTLLESSVSISDQRPAVVTPNQELSVDQRVINISEDKNVVVLNISGPSSLSNRQLWSRGKFKNGQQIINVWGIYSSRQYFGGKKTTNSNTNPTSYHFPHTLDTYITAKNEELTLRTDRSGEFTYSLIPTVVEYDRTPASGTNASLPLNTSLETAEPFIYRTIVIENSPSYITEFNDVHGNNISVNTTEKPYHPTEIKVTEIGEDQAKIQLIDAETGQSVPNRTLYLGGAKKDTVTTDNNGEAVVQVTNLYVSIRFGGNDWKTNQPLYFGSSSKSYYMGDDIKFMERLGNLTQRISRIAFWVLLLLFARKVGKNT